MLQFSKWARRAENILAVPLKVFHGLVPHSWVLSLT